MSTVITVRRQMPAERLFFAASSVLPVQPVTRPVPILKRNAAPVSLRHHMFVTAVTNRITTAPLHTNIPTMHALRIASTKRSSATPELESTSQNGSYTKKDIIVSPLIQQGQSPYQIVTNHPELEMSVRTVYTYMNMGLFTARNIDLKRKVKFKSRKCHKTQITNRSVFVNRTFADFSELHLSRFTEMDTVHSSRESDKVLLTSFSRRRSCFLLLLWTAVQKALCGLYLTAWKTYGHLWIHFCVRAPVNRQRFRIRWPGRPGNRRKRPFNVQASIIAPQWGAARKAVLSRHTRCCEWYSRKEPALSSWHSGMWTWLWITSTPLHEKASAEGHHTASHLKLWVKKYLNAFQLRPIAPDEVNLTPKLIRFKHN